MGYAMPKDRSILTTVFCVGLLALTDPAQAQEKAAPVFVDGQAQVVPAFEDASQWIQHDLWVETEFDSDGDGRARPHARGRDPARADRERGPEGPGRVRDQSLLLGRRIDRTSSFFWDPKQEVGDRASRAHHRPRPFRIRAANVPLMSKLARQGPGFRAASRSSTPPRPAPASPRVAPRSVASTSPWPPRP